MSAHEGFAWVTKSRTILVTAGVFVTLILGVFAFNMIEASRRTIEGIYDLPSDVQFQNSGSTMRALSLRNGLVQELLISDRGVETNATAVGSYRDVGDGRFLGTFHDAEMEISSPDHWLTVTVRLTAVGDEQTAANVRILDKTTEITVRLERHRNRWW